MKTTVLNWASIVTLFGLSAYIVISRYSETHEQEAATTEGLSIVGVALLTFIALIAISFFIANLKGLILDKPFGKAAITIYAGLFALLTLGIYFWVSAIQSAAEANVAAFIDNMNYHKTTLWYLLLASALSLIIAWADWAIVLIKRIK